MLPQKSTFGDISRQKIFIFVFDDQNFITKKHFYSLLKVGIASEILLWPGKRNWPRRDDWSSTQEFQEVEGASVEQSSSSVGRVLAR